MNFSIRKQKVVLIRNVKWLRKTSPFFAALSSYHRRLYRNPSCRISLVSVDTTQYSKFLIIHNHSEDENQSESFVLVSYTKIETRQKARMSVHCCFSCSESRLKRIKHDVTFLICFQTDKRIREEPRI